MLDFAESSFSFELALWQHTCHSNVSTLLQLTWNTLWCVLPASMVNNTSAQCLDVALPLSVTVLVFFDRTISILDNRYPLTILSVQQKVASSPLLSLYDIIFTEGRWPLSGFHVIHVFGCSVYVLHKPIAHRKKIPC
jgi:hypothetical protein